MRTSETITNISKALLAAQKAITFAVANAENTHLKNKYADLSSVIEAIKEPLNTNGILFIQSPGECPEGKYCLILTTRLLHAESCEWIENTATVPLAKADPQGFGSALTYARRYNLAALLGLYQEDDDGQDASPPPSKVKAETKAKNVKQAQQQKVDVDQKLADLEQITDVAVLRTTLSAIRKQLVASGQGDEIKRVTDAATAMADKLKANQPQQGN